MTRILVHAGLAAPCRRRGFALVETLVAFALLALAAAALLPPLSAALARGQDSDRRIEAALAARSLLDALVPARLARPGAWEGTTEGGLDWRLEARWRPGTASGLLEVSVSVERPGTAPLRLVTLRPLAPAPGA